VNKWFREVSELADRFREIHERFYEEVYPKKFEPIFWTRLLEFERARGAINGLLDGLKEIEKESK
jgi:hypothetical protein